MAHEWAAFLFTPIYILHRNSHAARAMRLEPVPAPREPSPPEQQPGFYDPSNAKTANGGAAAVDDDYPDDTLRAQQPRHNVAEPEEKILVDQPAELPAAPDDDDDGIPVMSATSYPGQEWNPYGYGEFGDWD